MKNYQLVPSWPWNQTEPIGSVQSSVPSSIGLVLGPKNWEPVLCGLVLGLRGGPNQPESCSPLDLTEQRRRSWISVVHGWVSVLLASHLYCLWQAWPRGLVDVSSIFHFSRVRLSILNLCSPTPEASDVRVTPHRCGWAKQRRLEKILEKLRNIFSFGGLTEYDSFFFGGMYTYNLEGGRGTISTNAFFERKRKQRLSIDLDVMELPDCHPLSIAGILLMCHELSCSTLYSAIWVPKELGSSSTHHCWLWYSAFSSLRMLKYVSSLSPMWKFEYSELDMLRTFKIE